MKIHIPNSAFLGNIDPFIESFDPENEELLEISFNEKWISVHPVILCMVSALGLYVRKKGGKILCDVPTERSKHYLERMGLFNLLELDSEMNIEEHDPSGRFIPLSIIKNSQDIDKFITEIVPLLHLNPNQAESIKYIISELVRNVFEHSYSPFGAIVCAQYYAKSNRISIGVCDRGIGIKQSIMRSYSAENDRLAIRLALTPGITGQTRKTTGTARNAGAGLFFIKSLAKVNRDFFVIYSGDSMFKLLKTSSKQQHVRLYINPEKDHCSIKENLPYWNGTVVGIDISLDNIGPFDSFLKKLGEVYRKDLKEKKNKKLKKARFI